jgi:hypothetical protein
VSLKPRNLIQAADADLARRKRNMRRYELAAQGVDCGDRVELYAFYAPHVRKAKTAHDLIALALNRNAGALKCTKKNTRLIYGDLALLRDALTICGEEVAA